MNDEFTVQIYSIYGNEPESCIQLLSYLAENPNDRRILKDLQSNERGFKQYADALLIKAKTNSEGFENFLWKYIAQTAQNMYGFVFPMFTFGVAGAVTFGPLGATAGAFVGGCFESIRQHYYQSVENNLPEDLKNAYTFLGISSSVTDEEVNNAYHEKCRIYHPDKAGATDAQAELNHCVTLIRNSRSNNLNQNKTVLT